MTKAMADETIALTEAEIEALKAEANELEKLKSVGKN
jgi:hypothetical protein